MINLLGSAVTPYQPQTQQSASLGTIPGGSVQNGLAFGGSTVNQTHGQTGFGGSMTGNISLPANGDTANHITNSPPQQLGGLITSPQQTVSNSPSNQVSNPPPQQTQANPLEGFMPSNLIGHSMASNFGYQPIDYNPFGSQNNQNQNQNTGLTGGGLYGG